MRKIKPNFEAVALHLPTFGVRCQSVISTDRCNTLVFIEKMECLDEAKTSDIFYESTEVGDMGSLATRRVDEFNWTRI
jgi:hypothetical protein